MVRKGHWSGDVVLDEDRNHFIRVCRKKRRNFQQSAIQWSLIHSSQNGGLSFCEVTKMVMLTGLGYLGPPF